MTYAVKKNAEGIEMIDIVNGLRRIAEEGYRFAGDAADEIERLRASLEAAETDAAHQKALTDSALRVAEGWERKCDSLRADKATLQQMMYSLKDRLEVAEKERESWKGLAKQFGQEADALRAKIERMEQQEPVWFIDERGEPKRYHKSKADYCKYGGLDLLYTLPGAKGE